LGAGARVFSPFYLAPAGRKTMRFIKVVWALALGGATYVSDEWIRANARRLLVALIVTRPIAHNPARHMTFFAMIFAFGSTEDKVLARQKFLKVVRSGIDLLHFVDDAKSLRGWGRCLRKSVACFYEEAKWDEYDLALQKIGGWTHRDVIRLCHPHTNDVNRAAALQFLSGGL